MITINTKPSKNSIYLLAALAVVLYFIGVCVHEVRLSDEALIAAFANDMVKTGSMFNTSVFGKSVPGFPLYSWLVAVFSLFHSPNSLTLRLPAVTSIFILAAASGLFARKIQSDFAGIIAASMILTSIFGFRVGIRAHNDIVASVLMSCAWYIAYVFCWRRQKWWLGWTAALSLVLLACFGIGIKALIIFYLPFFFMGRRLRGVDVMFSKQHLGVFSGLLFFIIFWLSMVKGQPFMPWSALAFIQPDEGWFTHILLMLPKIFFYLFPWSFIAWAPFCLALRQFESDDRACKFLRAIVISNAVMFWLMPGGSPLHLLPVFGPMAVLTAVYSEIVFRRYHEYLAKQVGFCMILCCVLSLLCSLFWACVLMNIIQLVDFSICSSIFGLICSMVAASISGSLLLIRHYRLNFRTYLLLGIFSVVIAWYGTVSMLYSWKVMYHEVNGLCLADCEKMVDMDHEIEKAYIHGSNIFDFYRETSLNRSLKKGGISVIYMVLPSSNSMASMLAEAFYMRCHIVQCDKLPDVSKEPVVYYLSQYVPVDTSREWTALSPTVSLGLKKGNMNWSWNKEDFTLFGKNALLRCTMTYDENEIKLPDEINEIRLYCGIPKQVENQIER